MSDRNNYRRNDRRRAPASDDQLGGEQDLAKTGKLPPHSAEAEKAILGCMLLSYRETEQYLSEYLGQTVPTDAFYDHRHQILAEILFDKGSQNSTIDLITVSEALRENQALDAVGGVAYLSELMDCVPSIANAPTYADIVIKKALIRRNIQDLTRIVSDAFNCEDNVDEHHANVEKALMRLLNRHQSGQKEKSIKDYVKSAINKMDEDMNSGGVGSGMKTGIGNLDRMLIGGGLQPKTMGIIAARPSLGKTSLVMNIAEYVALETKLPVGVFSLEMSGEDLTYRLLCSRAKVDSRRMRNGIVSQEELQRLTLAASQIANANIHIDDSSGYNIVQLKAKARRMKQVHKIKLMVIDYLQLLHGSKKSSSEFRQQEISEISGGIKDIAKELEIPVIVLSQLNRGLEKERRRPRLSDLRESGSLEQDGDWILLLSKRKNSEDEELEELVAEDSIAMHGDMAKQRNGPTGPIPLVFIKSLTRYMEAAKISDEDIPE